MSYIQIEIGGKLRGLKFNQGALMTFKEKTNLKRESATLIYALVYAGLTANADAKEQEFADEVDGKMVEISYEQVCDWVDELSDEVQGSIWDSFAKSVVYQKRLQPLIEAQLPVDEEKKTTVDQPIEPTASESPVES